MKAYRFTMEKVLEHRSRVEKDKLEDYAQIHKDLSEEMAHVETLKHAMDERAEMKNSDLQGLRMQFLYKEKLAENLRDKERAVVEISGKLEHARGHLIDARKDRTIMENLKSKEEKRYLKERQRAEQKELDDLTLMKFAR